MAAHACSGAAVALKRCTSDIPASCDRRCRCPARQSASRAERPAAAKIVSFFAPRAAAAASGRMQGRRAPQVRQGHGHYLPPSQLHGAQPSHQQQQQHHGHHEQHHAPGHAHHHGHHQQAAVAAPPPGAARHLTSTTFASLPLSPSSQRALAEVLRFTHLTEVQNATLPVVSAGDGRLFGRVCLAHGRRWMGGQPWSHDTCMHACGGLASMLHLASSAMTQTGQPCMRCSLLALARLHPLACCCSQLLEACPVCFATAHQCSMRHH